MPNRAASRASHELQPPYVSYGQFKGVLDRLPNEPLPARIATAAWGVPAQTAERISHALRFLGFVTDDLEPTLQLRRFGRATAEDRKAILRSIVESRFPGIFELPPDMPYDAFLRTLSETFGVTRARSSRTASFIVAAAADLGMPLPIARRKKGRPKKMTTAPPEAEGLLGVVQGLADHLLKEARRAASDGDAVREHNLLDRLERISLAVLDHQRR